MSLKIGADDVDSIVEPTSSMVWADLILADFQRVISRYMQDISTYLSCIAQRVLRTTFMQKSKINLRNCGKIIFNSFNMPIFKSVGFCFHNILGLVRTKLNSLDIWKYISIVSSFSPVCQSEIISTLSRFVHASIFWALDLIFVRF